MSYDYESLRTNGDEQEANLRYYRDYSNISDVLPEIKSGEKDNVSVTLALWIRQKAYGRDVRESIAQFVEWTSVLVGQFFRKANSISNRQDLVEEKQDALTENQNNFISDFNKKMNAQISGNTDLNEVIDARMDNEGVQHLTLKERLDDNLSIESAGIAELELGGGEPKPVFKQSLEEFIAKVDTTKFNMSIITDTHWDDVVETSYPSGNVSVSHYSNFLALNKVSDVQIVDGDNYDCRHLDLDASRLSYEALVSKLYDRELENDLFINLGNHDDGSDRFPAGYKYKNSEFFTEDQLKDIIRTKELKFGEKRKNGDSLYWYKDYPEHKIRVIGLWSQDMPEGLTDAVGNAKYKRIHTHAFRQEQLNWLANVALKNLQADYQVIITTHVPLYYGWQVSANAPINHDIVGGILHAFMAGAAFTGNSTKADFEASVSADFSTQGPHKLVGWFSGHNHFAARYNWDGINIVILDFSAGNNAGDLGTDKEDAISMVEVDTKTNTVNIKGWGRATSSSYKY